jgi:hypothetical protein
VDELITGDRVFARAQVQALTEAVTGLASHPGDSELERLQRIEPLAAAVADLVDVPAVGFLLCGPGGEVAVGAASTATARGLEELQLRYGEGPCVDAIRTGEPLHVPDLAAARGRWPRFEPAATAAGLCSLAALPLRVEGVVVGGLNLFGTVHAVLAEADERLAQTLGEAAAGSVLGRRSVDRYRVEVEQLQTALTTRIVIEQAKGVLSNRHGVDMEAGFQLLRHCARDNNLKLSAAARGIVSGELCVRPERLGRPDQPGQRQDQPSSSSTGL